MFIIIFICLSKYLFHNLIHKHQSLWESLWENASQMLGARNYVGLQREHGWMLPCVYISSFIWSLFFYNLPLSNSLEADYTKFDTLSLCAYLPHHCFMLLCRNNTYSVSCYSNINVGLWRGPLLIHMAVSTTILLKNHCPWQLRYLPEVSLSSKNLSWISFQVGLIFKYYVSMILRSHFFLKRLNQPVQKLEKSVQFLPIRCVPKGARPLQMWGKEDCVLEKGTEGTSRRSFQIRQMHSSDEGCASQYTHKGQKRA